MKLWLAEQRKTKSTDDVTKLCAELRAFYYPKQAAYYTSKAKRRATRKTRRMGATVGGVREFVARALETPGWRGVYVASTLDEARGRAWESDTQSGFADVLRKIGTAIPGRGVERVSVAGIDAELRDADLEVNFSNGSKIELVAFDDGRSLRKMRGLAKHVVWVDEAQDFRFLESFYKAVIVGCLTDYDGECWLSGTPGKDCAGLFYDVTRADGQQLPGWEVHEMSVTDNPFFGRVDGQWVIDNVGERHGPFDDPEHEAARIRWERTAGQAIRDNHWADDDPDLIREWYGRWVKTDARFVYAVHTRPLHELVYAPCRVVETAVPYDGFPDVKAAMADLPEYPKREYWTALGGDLGTRDAFAFVLWAWSLQDPVLYEVCSWKRSGLDYDEMEACLVAVREQVHISMIVGDAGGGGLGAVTAWSKRWNARYGVVITPANKTPGYKPVVVKQYNTDVKQGRIRYRDGSPLLKEQIGHRWLAKRSASGTEIEDPGTENHCCFVAGTMIETELGPRGVENVCVGDRVWTRLGLRQVTHAWCTGQRPVTRLQHEHGNLVGTVDHPIWTAAGWIPLATLTPGTMLTSWASTESRSPSSSMARVTADIQNHRGENFGCTSQAKMDDDCTVISGRRRMGRYQPDTISTISTVTQPTIDSRTSSALMVGSTVVNTVGSLRDWQGSHPVLAVREWKQPNGTARRRGEHGMQSMLPRSWQPLHCYQRPALFAVDHLGLSAAEPCAATNALPNSVETLELTTSRSHVFDAEPSTRETAIRIPVTAPSRVLAVQRLSGNALVYNLTVEGEHEYFANGILVSNCDAGLYAHMESYHHRYRPEVAKPKPGSVEYVKAEESALERYAIQSQFADDEW